MSCIRCHGPDSGISDMCLPCERAAEAEMDARDSLLYPDPDEVRASLARQDRLYRGVVNPVEATATIQSCAISIRELGEMVQAIDSHPDFRERLVELERLASRIGMRLATLRGLIDAEYVDASGAGS